MLFPLKQTLPASHGMCLHRFYTAASATVLPHKDQEETNKQCCYFGFVTHLEIEEYSQYLESNLTHLILQPREGSQESLPSPSSKTEVIKIVFPFRLNHLSSALAHLMLQQSHPLSISSEHCIHPRGCDYGASTDVILSIPCPSKTAFIPTSFSSPNPTMPAGRMQPQPGGRCLPPAPLAPW